MLTGNSGATAAAGNDRLDGGTGNDAVVGGTGNDTYVVNVSTDVVAEQANEGIDTVESSVTLTLADNVENITLTGSDDIDATGNALDNVLTSNTGRNKLEGGRGDDTYIVNNSNDQVKEKAGEGTDTVQSSVSYQLSDNVENLTFTGAAAIAGDRQRPGQRARQQRRQHPEATAALGADTLIGGAGNDTYVVDNSGDVVTELRRWHRSGAVWRLAHGARSRRRESHA